MGKFRFVEAFWGGLNENSNYRGFRITGVRISEVLLYLFIRALFALFATFVQSIRVLAASIIKSNYFWMRVFNVSLSPCGFNPYSLALLRKLFVVSNLNTSFGKGSRFLRGVFFLENKIIVHYNSQTQAGAFKIILISNDRKISTFLYIF